MTVEERKHLLLVACTIDRLQLGLLRGVPQARKSRVAKILSTPWFEAAFAAIVPLLPRRLRLFVTLAKSWQKYTQG